MTYPGFLFTSDRRELVVSVRSHRDEHAVARRANVILLLDDGKSYQAIAKFLYMDDVTILGGYKSYRTDGWDTPFTDGRKGSQLHMTSAEVAKLQQKSSNRNKE